MLLELCTPRYIILGTMKVLFTFCTISPIKKEKEYMIDYNYLDVIFTKDIMYESTSKSSDQFFSITKITNPLTLMYSLYLFINYSKLLW